MKNGFLNILFFCAASAAMVLTNNLGLAQEQFPVFSTIHSRIAQQLKLIKEGQISGSLTVSQAASMRKVLFNVRQQAMAFLKKNKPGDLTPQQENQLEQTMNKNSQAIGEKPVTGADQ